MHQIPGDGGVLRVGSGGDRSKGHLFRYGTGSQNARDGSRFMKSTRLILCSGLIISRYPERRNKIIPSTPYAALGERRD